jgi:hypothetical protein
VILYTLLVAAWLAGVLYMPGMPTGAKVLVLCLCAPLAVGVYVVLWKERHRDAA